jgi:hypothetical protein
MGRGRLGRSLLRSLYLCAERFDHVALSASRHIWWMAALGLFGAFVTLVAFAFRDDEEIEISAEQIAQFEPPHEVERTVKQLPQIERRHQLETVL